MSSLRLASSLIKHIPKNIHKHILHATQRSWCRTFRSIGFRSASWPLKIIMQYALMILYFLTKYRLYLTSVPCVIVSWCDSAGVWLWCDSGMVWQSLGVTVSWCDLRCHTSGHTETLQLLYLRRNRLFRYFEDDTPRNKVYDLWERQSQFIWAV